MWWLGGVVELSKIGEDERVLRGFCQSHLLQLSGQK